MVRPRWLVVLLAGCALTLTVALAVRWRYLGPVAVGDGAGAMLLVYDTWRGRFCAPSGCTYYAAAP
jgi:hypothetical protein